jgi:hypothetical protein
VIADVDSAGARNVVAARIRRSPEWHRLRPLRDRVHRSVRRPASRPCHVPRVCRAVAFRAVHRPSTRAHVETQLRRHAYPVLGDRPLSSVRPSDVQAGRPVWPRYWRRHSRHSARTEEVGYEITAGQGHVRDELACKPDSVARRSRTGNHPSRTTVADGLVRSTRELGWAALERSLYDLAPGGVCRAARVTPGAGGLLHHRFTLAERRSARRSAFCGTVPRVAPGGRYPPPCPVESGLSSAEP